jgi:hypothetical protein
MIITDEVTNMLKRFQGRIVDKLLPPHKDIWRLEQQVADLLGDPEYLQMDERHRRQRNYPATPEEMIRFIQVHGH